MYSVKSMSFIVNFRKEDVELAGYCSSLRPAHRGIRFKGAAGNHRGGGEAPGGFALVRDHPTGYREPARCGAHRLPWPPPDPPGRIDRREELLNYGYMG